MASKNIIKSSGFKQSQILAVFAVFMIVSLLLMFEKVAEIVTEIGDYLGVNMPAVPVLRQTAANLFMVGAGVVLVLLSAIIIVPLVKFALIGAGLALVGYGLYQVYNLIKGRPIKDILPGK